MRSAIDTEGALASLYKHRPDLWSITVFLKHCRQGPYADMTKMVWAGVTEADRGLLRQVAAGIAIKPEIT